LAIHSALQNGADALWLSVQLSADGVPVMYRPRDLSALTEGKGLVASLPVARLQALNAGYRFSDANGGFPYRARPQPIARLDQALAAIPRHLPVMLDMKAEPSAALVQAVAAVLARGNDWARTWLYSTDAGYAPLWQPYPQAQVMESRDATRQRLLELVLAQRCVAAPEAPGWAAFELRRNLKVSESFTLGKGHTAVSGARLWTPEAMVCFRSHAPEFSVLWIGVGSEEDYKLAADLGADAVMVDSPRQARAWREAVKAVAGGSGHRP
ncbi:MAG TPA: glycerophosphodiester phosphodiesterase family protein, partial [Stenotrophomonas sp.]|nr:glycerophosphodiester phosphodiesterase family protein [Stenotrophomonas sp.]